MTKQEYLDLILQKSRDGMFPASKQGSEICMYRAGNGRQCLIGLLIPDRVYTPIMENQDAHNIWNMIAKYMPSWLTSANASILQAIHDDLAYSISRGHLKEWSHERFVQKLLLSNLFDDCVFPQES